MISRTTFIYKKIQYVLWTTIHKLVKDSKGH